MPTTKQNPISEEIEESLLVQIAKTPPGEHPPPTVSALGCVGAVLVGLFLLMGVHFLLDQFSFSALLKLPIEFGTTFLAGYMIVMLWKRSHRSWGAMTDEGLPASREELYQGYARLLAPGWEQLAQLEYLEGHPDFPTPGNIRLGHTEQGIVLIQFHETQKADVAQINWEEILEIQHTNKELSLRFLHSQTEANAQFFTGEGKAAPLAQTLKSKKKTQ